MEPALETCLITGGAGNLACRLSFELSSRARRLLLCDILPSPIAPVATNCEYVRGDLTDFNWLRNLIAEYRPTTILHFASYLSASSEANRRNAWKLNMDSAFELFELSKEFNVQRFLFPSSTASYGGNLPNPLPEDWPQWPGGLYGVTKQSVERLGVYYHAKHGLDFRALRLPIVISPTAVPGAASAYASRAFIESVADGRFTFRVRPETRPSIIYLEDVVRAMIGILEAPEECLSRRTYNIFSMCPSAAELADSIRMRLPNAELTFDPDPALIKLIESWPIGIEDVSARRDWGWRPGFNLDAATEHFIKLLNAQASTISHERK